MGTCGCSGTLVDVLGALEIVAGPKVGVEGTDLSESRPVHHSRALCIQKDDTLPHDVGLSIGRARYASVVTHRDRIP